MKLGEALQSRNDLQQTLSRLHKQRTKLFQIGTKNTDFDYETVNKEIIEIHIKINKLKVDILKTNLETYVTIELDKPIRMNLQEAILEVTMFKSELSEFSEFEPDNEFERFRSRRDKDEIIDRPLTDVELSDHIKQLEVKKRLYNHAIQGVNWNTSLKSI